MQNPGTPERLAAYMFIVNPVVCPKCLVRYPKGTKVCSVCGKEIPQKGD
jgi:predicted amidophosphoribosyltransferase